MTGLLETVIEAHGGLTRWNQLETVTAHLSQGGAIWALKNQPGVLDDVYITANLHHEWESHYPFGSADRNSAFTPQRVAIETGDGALVEGGTRPRKCADTTPRLGSAVTARLSHIGSR